MTVHQDIMNRLNSFNDAEFVQTNVLLASEFTKRLPKVQRAVMRKQFSEIERISEGRNNSDWPVVLGRFVNVNNRLHDFVSEIGGSKKELALLSCLAQSASERRAKTNRVLRNGKER